MVLQTLPAKQLTSAHARKRQQQRAINNEAINAALEHGRILYLNGGCRAHFLGCKELKSLGQHSPRLAQKLRPYQRTTVIISNRDSMLVTTYRCSNPVSLRRNCR